MQFTKNKNNENEKCDRRQKPKTDQPTIMLQEMSGSM